jgi:hypothetical protein
MEATNQDAGSNVPSTATGVRARRIRVGAVVAVALAIGFVLWLVLRDDDSSPATAPTTTTASTTSVPITVKGLHSLAALGVPIYWAGEQPGVRYELTKTAGSRVLLRYLPAGEKIGTKTPYLTIGTYPMKNAFGVTSRVARSSSSVTIPVGHGGVAFYSRTAPTSVYVAYPGYDYQVEVFDPAPAQARSIATGRLAPIG